MQGSQRRDAGGLQGPIRVVNAFGCIGFAERRRGGGDGRQVAPTVIVGGSAQRPGKSELSGVDADAADPQGPGGSVRSGVLNPEIENAAIAVIGVTDNRSVELMAVPPEISYLRE